MAENLGVLGQTAPAADTDTDLYIVPASTEAVVSSLVVANRAAAAATFRVAVSPGGAALADEHYLVFDPQVGANASVAFRLGIALAAGDVVRVRAGSADVSFSAFGSEVT